ncbi:2OG-Fe(II) oxygenase superfamily protein [Aspergillus coremiiformis]|uniref:2OG-Fe(II) oxygenase superfamily protein n=1 Tax=Aspergillus coremiiformis TaxID=138285 RepID=A0A5N6Z401_9EURO|nr:2OG-Fe(II) oxygenase superfamily protein [Aspergillus coremiiformis]
MAQTQYTHVELLTLNGPEFRRVSTAPPRPPTDDEIPVIDLHPIHGDQAARAELAARVRAAATNTGFFYIKNHGIPEQLITEALSQAEAFFSQSDSDKKQVSSSKFESAMGYHGVGSTQINRTESQDRKETFSLRYNPRMDPTIDDAAAWPERDDALLWEGTAHLPNFRETTIAFWQARLALARKIVRIFALSLALPEDYFDGVVTHPGADGLYIHYPGTPDTEHDSQVDLDVGIGSHTDIQCFTLLWQDMSGGLQVLSATDEWIDARPIPGTLVVNIGDFLQRLSNNQFKSTVHRVYNRQSTSRYSMPFFLGFNPESVCRVVPSCIDKDHPALYEPISCGKWHRDRLALAHTTPVAV